VWGVLTPLLLFLKRRSSSEKHSKSLGKEKKMCG
jgi:hypothetical protein